MIIYIGLIIYFFVWREKRVKQLTAELERKLQNQGFETSEKVTLRDHASFMLGIRPKAGIWFDFTNKRIFIRPFQKYKPENPLLIINFADILDFQGGWLSSKKITKTTYWGFPISQKTDNFTSKMELRILYRSATGDQVVFIRPSYNNKIKNDGVNSFGDIKRKRALQQMYDLLQQAVTKYCPKCGAVVPQDVAFCSSCGAKIG